jgi:hypothetical protein
MIEQTDDAQNPDVTVKANEDGVLVSTPNDLEDKLAEVRRKLGLNNEGQPVEPFEAGADDDEDGPTNSRPSGADVDWTPYDLPTQYEHLYRRPSTTLLMTDEGPKWVAIVDDFFALRAPYAIIGLRIAQMVNGPEDWRLMSAVVPGGQMSRAQCKAFGYDPSLAGGVGIVTLQRKVTVKLPTPNLLKTEQDDAVAPPTDSELKTAEDAALSWIDKEGQAQAGAPANDADTPSETPVNAVTRAIGAAEGANPQEIVGDRVLPGARTAASEAVNG